MKKLTKRLVSLALVLVLLMGLFAVPMSGVSAASTKNNWVTSYSDPDINGDGTIKILIIGNSYGSNLRHMLQDYYLPTQSKKVILAAQYIGFSGMYSYYRDNKNAEFYACQYNTNEVTANPDIYGSPTTTVDGYIGQTQYADVVAKTNWDIVMLQESPYGAADATQYTSYLSGFVKAIKDAHASSKYGSQKMSLAWFMTWSVPASIPGGTGGSDYQGTNLDEYKRISECVNNYVAASGSFDAIFPCATMIQNARTAHTDNYVVTEDYLYDGMCTDNLHIVSGFSRYMAAYGFMKFLGLNTSIYDNASEFKKQISGSNVPADYQVEPEKTYRANRMNMVMEESVNNALKNPQGVTQSVYTDPIADICNGGGSHSYSTAKVVAATCEEGGYTTQTCSKCGYLYIYDKVEKLGHSYKVTGQTDPTCTQNGYIYQYCTRCNEENNQTISGGHSYGNWEVVKEATRTETGTKRKTCTVCGEYYEEEIPLVTDNVTYDIAFETKEAYDEFNDIVIRADNNSGRNTTDEYMYWSESDKAFITKFVANDSGTPSAHQMVAIKTPDNTYGASYTLHAGGGYSYDTTTAAPGVILAHDDYGYYGIKAYVAANGALTFQHYYMTEPTSTNYGYSTKIACTKNSSPNIVKVDGVEVTASNNVSDVSVIEVSKANNNQQFFTYKYHVTSDGYDTVYLTVDLIYNDLISSFTATTETISFTVDSAAEIISSTAHTKFGSAFGFFRHSYGKQITYTNANGETVNHDHDSRVYSIRAEYAELAPCEHKSTKTVAAVAATCTTVGTEAAVVCNACGETISGGETVAALGHDYVTNTTIAATCTETGTSTTTCSRCDYSSMVVVPALGHTMGEFTVTREAACTVDGIKTGICSVCGAAATEVIPAIGHAYGDFVVTKDATCTTSGVKTKTCSNCDGTVTATISATGHSYGDWVITSQPTDTEDGSKIRTCNSCGNTETAAVPKDSDTLIYDWDFSNSADYTDLKENACVVATTNLNRAKWDGESSTLGYVSAAKAVGFKTSLNQGTAGFVIDTPITGGAEAQPATFRLSTHTFVPASVSSTTQIGTATLAGIIFAKNDSGYFIFQPSPTSVFLSFQSAKTSTDEGVILNTGKTLIMSNQVIGAEGFSINGVKQELGLTANSKKNTYLGYFVSLLNELISEGYVKGETIPTTTAGGMGTADYYSKFSADYEVTVAANNNITIDYTMYYTSEEGDVVAFDMFPMVLSNGVVNFYKSANTVTEATIDLSSTLTDKSPIIPVFGAVTYPTNVQSGVAYATVDTIYAEYTEPCAHSNTRTDEAVDATCTETGRSKCVYCADCGQLLSGNIGGGVIAALGHNYESSVTSEPKCFADGTLADGTITHACTRCDDYYNVTIKASHNFGEWEITKAASATETGSRQCSCSLCGALITKEIPKTTSYVYDWDYTAGIASAKDAADTCDTVLFMDSSPQAIYSGEDYHVYDFDNGSFDIINQQGTYMLGLINTPEAYIPSTFSITAYAETYEMASPTPGVIVAVDDNATNPTYYYFQVVLSGGCTYYNLRSFKRSSNKTSSGYYSLSPTNIATNVKIGDAKANNYNLMYKYIETQITKYGSYYPIQLAVKYDVTVTNGVITITPTVDLYVNGVVKKTMALSTVTADNTLFGLDSSTVLTPVFGFGTHTGRMMTKFTESYPELATGNEDKCRIQSINATYTIDGNSPSHVHTYDEGKDVPATCTTGGYTLYTCKLCAGTYKENETPARGHDYITTTTAATCTVDGSTVTTCSRCNYKDVVVIPATGHTFADATVTKEATCTEDGVKTGVCTVCGETATEAIPMLGHSYGDWVVDTEATTSTPGSKHKTCSACGDTVTEEIPVIVITSGYNWNFEGSNGANDASEMLENITHIAGYTGSTAEVINELKIGYDENSGAFEIAVPKAYTTSSGASSNIFYNINGMLVTAPEGATPMQMQVEVGADERVAANAQHTAGVIYATDTNSYGIGLYSVELLYKGGFKMFIRYTTTKTKQPVSSDGTHIMYGGNTVIAYDQCAPRVLRAIKDGQIVADRETGLNESYLSNYSNIQKNIATDLTASAPSVNDLKNARVKYEVEIVDGVTYINMSYVFKTAAHIYELVFPAMTVDESGTITYVHNSTSYTYSFVENEKTEGANYTNVFGVVQHGNNGTSNENVQIYSLSAIYAGGDSDVGGHTHGYTVGETVAATCTEDGYTLYVCDCGESITGNPVAALGHDYVENTTPATCTEDGATVTTCSRCDYESTTTIPAVGHTLGSSKVTKPATCIEDGIRTGTCKLCGETATSAIPATGHSYGNWVIDKEATTTTAGSQHKTCTACGDTITESIPVVQVTTNFDWKFDGSGGSAEVTDMLSNSTHIVGYGNTNTEAVAGMTAGYDAASAALELSVPLKYTTSSGTLANLNDNINAVLIDAPMGSQPTKFSLSVGTDDCTQANNLYGAGVIFGKDDSSLHAFKVVYKGGFKMFATTVSQKSLVDITAGYEQWQTACTNIINGSSGVTVHFQKVLVNGQVAKNTTYGIIADREQLSDYQLGTYFNSYSNVQKYFAEALPTSFTPDELKNLKINYDVEFVDGNAVITASAVFKAGKDTYELVFTPVTMGSDGTISYMSNSTGAINSTSYSFTPGENYHNTTGVLTHGNDGKGNVNVQVYSVTASYVGSEIHNHTYSVTEEVDATCEKEGCITYTCSECGFFYTETYEALGHDYVTTTIDATCTVDGSTTVTCTRCDYESVTVISAGHTPGEWIIDTEPTKESEGSAHIECTVCHDVLETKTLDKLPEGILGDVNGDGRVNTGDAVIVARYSSKLADLPEGFEAFADVNGDGRVNTGDAVLIARYASKLIVEFPVEQKTA